jgi:hypothetical protein
MPDRSSRRLRDLNSLAASVVGDATDETPDHYTYEVVWSEEDAEWVGVCPRFPSLSWLDPDKGKALAGIERLVQAVTADMAAEGGKNAAAAALGRKGGLKGGKARAAKLSPARRSEIAKKAAEKRWKSGQPPAQ